jgi:hypothetical protein
MTLLGGIVMAACALPGVMPTSVRAEEAPEQGVISLKYSSYQDSQATSTVTAGGGGCCRHDSGAESVRHGQPWATISGASQGGGGGGGYSEQAKRIGVSTPAVYALVPINRSWAAEGSLTVDDISGASPAYYTDMASAQYMKDTRRAADFKLTHYAERQTLAFGLAHSKESDYLSNAVSAEARFASDDQNTTWNIGLGLTSDRVNPKTQIVTNAAKRTNELQFGVTQALSPLDLVQVNVTLSHQSGYLNDPYKWADARPDARGAGILQLRWNHWLGGSALKSAYRYYTDSFGIRAHTMELAWVMPLGQSFTVTPELRYYTQSAAKFYTDPSLLIGGYPGPVGDPTYFSADQRLSAFGAGTAGLKVEWAMSPRWSVDAKADAYHQDTAWHLGGSGSPGLQALNAVFWQVGMSYHF